MNYRQTLIRISTFKICSLFFQDETVTAINHLLTSPRGGEHKYIKQGIIKSNNFSDTEEIKIIVSGNPLASEQINISI